MPASNIGRMLPIISTGFCARYAGPQKAFSEPPRNVMHRDFVSLCVAHVAYRARAVPFPSSSLPLCSALCSACLPSAAVSTVSSAVSSLPLLLSPLLPRSLRAPVYGVCLWPAENTILRARIEGGGSAFMNCVMRSMEKSRVLPMYCGANKLNEPQVSYE